MTFRVVYNYKPKTFDKDGKYVDNDTYTVSIGDFHREVTEDELTEFYEEIKKAIWDRNDTRGYHE